MTKNRDEKFKKKHGIETGYFEERLPYAKVGNKSKILLNIEALSYDHKPPSGFVLKQFLKFAKPFLEDYTVYQVGRKPNLPQDYLMDKMAQDYAKVIRKKFNNPIDIIGTSTGGQIAHYLAADHPDVVRKMVIISAAYRVSERGAEIESKAAEYFKQGKTGKSLSTTLDLIYTSGIKGKFLKFFTRLLGGFLMGDIEYPNDFLVEVKADIEMNFKDRLGEIKCPTLILSGAEDIEYSAENVKITAEGIPNSKLILYEGYGHNLAMANRDQVINDALNFLKG